SHRTHETIREARDRSDERIDDAIVSIRAALNAPSADATLTLDGRLHRWRNCRDVAWNDRRPQIRTCATLCGHARRREHAWEKCTMTTEPVHQSSLEEVARLRDCLNELTAAHERLKTEVVELRRTEHVLRANEPNFQLTVDSMPGMVHTMTATGAVEF